MITTANTSQVYKHVWVINNSDKRHVEKFKGNMIEIEPHGRIKMSRHEASDFRGQFPGDKVEKRIILEPIIPEREKEIFTCQLTGKTFDSKEEFKAHLDGIRDKIKKGK